MRLPLVLLAALIAISLLGQATLIEQGRAAIGRGESDDAIGVLERAVTQTPKSAEAHFYLATAYATAAQKRGMFGAAGFVSKIKAEYEKAIALNPKYVEARFALVEFYVFVPGIMGGSYPRAFAQAAEIKAMDPIVGHRAFAFIYAQQKKLDLAKKEYADALREEPGSPKAHSDFGQYLANVEKNYAAAFNELETALKLDSNYMPAFYHLGRTASLANSNLARGEEALKQYIAYKPKENEPTLASAHYTLGSTFEKQGRREEAKQGYQEALRLNPSLKQAAEALKRVS